MGEQSHKGDTEARALPQLGGTGAGGGVGGRAGCAESTEDSRLWVGSRWQAPFKGRGGGELLEQELKREGSDSPAGEEKRRQQMPQRPQAWGHCPPTPRTKGEGLPDDSPTWTLRFNKYFLSIYPGRHADVTQNEMRPGNGAEGCKPAASVTSVRARRREAGP